MVDNVDIIIEAALLDDDVTIPKLIVVLQHNANAVEILLPNRALISIAI
jgi:hypothetical protein